MNLSEKNELLSAKLHEYGSVLVAFSGGLDSSVLACAAWRELGDRAVAATATSASTPEGQLENAKAIARQIGIRHIVVETHEFDDPGYCANTPDRCYLCKRIILKKLQSVAEQEGLSTIADGSNADDRQDYRPGSRAVAELGVRTPLLDADLTKVELRELAKSWNLPNHDEPASPCLSTRVAYGLPITAERLAMIDRAEQHVRAIVGPKIPVRVRYLADETARIEVPQNLLPKLTNDPTVLQALIEQFHRLGFRYVTLNLEGFQSGNLNRMLD